MKTKGLYHFPQDNYYKPAVPGGADDKESLSISTYLMASGFWDTWDICLINQELREVDQPANPLLSL
jgi:hypothetical protein